MKQREIFRCMGLVPAAVRSAFRGGGETLDKEGNPYRSLFRAQALPFIGEPAPGERRRSLRFGRKGRMAGDRIEGDRCYTPFIMKKEVCFMIGAILGDIVGSRYEFGNILTKEFEFLHTAL